MMTYKATLVARVVDSEDTRRLRLKRHSTGRVLEKRLRDALDNRAGDWNPEVKHSKGQISVSLTLPARSEADAIERCCYWVERILRPARISLDPSEITRLEATCVGE